MGVTARTGSELRSYRPFVGGGWREVAASQWIEIVDPANEAVVARAARAGPEEVDAAVRAASDAAASWASWPPVRRGKALSALAGGLRRESERLAALEVEEVGKRIGKARGDVANAAVALDYYAGAADKLHGETIPVGSEAIDVTLLEPLGVTAHVVPWNAPLAMAVRSLAPALAVGCTAVVKPAEEACGSVFRLAELAVEAGLPSGVLNVIPGTGEEAGAALVAHPLVRGITFTGSVETGREVMKQAAQHVTPVVLELGGKSPMIVFDDADLERAARDAANGSLVNNGQVCIAASRVLVAESAYAPFLARLVDEFERRGIGPGAEDAELGPLVSALHRDRVLRYLDIARAEGAAVATGGSTPPDRPAGYYVQPTVLADVTPTMRCAREEIFGPVISAIPFRDEADAIRIANDVDYGLAAGVYGRDLGRALRVTRALEAGTVWVNAWGAGGVQAPVGGYKQSGIGREKGMAALANYVQAKNVVMHHG